MAPARGRRRGRRIRGDRGGSRRGSAALLAGADGEQEGNGIRYPSAVEDVSGALGRGGYEGIQDDSDGNIWIVESVAGLDNIQFLTRDMLLAVEDAGDTLHTQRKALDSGFAWDVTVEYSNTSNQPVRWLAEGRDPSATIDSAGGGFGKNDGDNELTGAHVSDGDPGVNGILGAKIPQPFDGKWRWFYTQQHGDNQLFEVLPAASRQQGDDESGD